MQLSLICIDRSAVITIDHLVNTCDPKYRSSTVITEEKAPRYRHRGKIVIYLVFTSLPYLFFFGKTPHSSPLCLIQFSSSHGLRIRSIH